MKEKIMIYVLMIGAIISGCIYAIYIQRTDMMFFELLYKGILIEYDTHISMQLIGSITLEYIKKAGIIMILGSFQMLMPFAIIVIFLLIFSYSFTTSCLVLLYGLKGLGGAFLLWGLQSILVTVLSLKYILYKYTMSSVNKSQEEKIQNREKIILMFLTCMSIIVGCDLIGILNFNLINRVFF